jgi:preprotein translocase subunit YajC
MPHPLLQLGLTSQGSFYLRASGPVLSRIDQEGVPRPKDIVPVGPGPAETQSGTAPAGETGQTSEGTKVPGGEKKAPQENPCGSEMFLMMGGMFVIVYFLMLRPQQKQEKKRRAMLAELGKGDKIVTSSGIHCDIVAVHAEEGTVTVKFGNDAGQRMKIDRAAIARVQGDEPAPAEKKG